MFGAMLIEVYSGFHMLLEKDVSVLTSVSPLLAPWGYLS